MERIEYYFNRGFDAFIAYLPQVLLALITLFIGIKLIDLLMRFLNKNLKKREMDDSLRKFLTNLISWSLKVLLFVSVFQMLGIATTSFIAILGAAGLAIGLALQGTLTNFAGGILLMIFKPYKIGDLVEMQGHLGNVDEIQIFTTHITTPDGKKVIMPNGAVSNGNIKNYTINGKIRVDLVFPISYKSDIQKAREVLIEIMKSNYNVMTDPAPFVVVSELAERSIVLAVRPHCDPAYYWDVYFDIYERGKIALDKNGITIPLPQLDVHLPKTN